MGRPEPCVLYAHTFVHPQLDEYVDEVLFSEPVFITACEFIEQNASSLCPAVKMMGATSPPSFALEVFIQSEGEARFRRLCLPCLYSQSSSNVLEVEALVTSHLVVRGSYRSLSMVIYGNTAEDLGQFNIEVDLDGSLTETVTTVEGNLEDLPPAFRPTKLSIEELMPSFKILSQAVVAFDISLELRQFLQLVFTTLDHRDLGAAAADKVLSLLLSVASTYANPCMSDTMTNSNQDGLVTLRSSADSDVSLTEAANEILQIGRELQNENGNPSESSTESLFVCDAGAPSSGELMETLHKHYDFLGSIENGNVGYPNLSQHSNTILWLTIARLLCSTRESCFHFVSCGGMKDLGYVFTYRLDDSTTLTLLVLGVIEQATRLSIGCEGLLGWWPREADNIPSGISDGYNKLLKLVLENQRHDVASLATHVLHRTRVYEVACRYEFAVLSVLGGLSVTDQNASLNLDMLASAKLQLKKLLKLLKLSGPIDDPSPIGSASRNQTVSDADLSTYKATSNLIKLSSCCFLDWDIDSHVLSLLKERGFLPLSAALLSSSVVRSGGGYALELFADAVSSIEAIVLLLLFCRSGLDFLLHDSEVSLTIIRALRGIEDVQNEDSISLRYASVLLSKGFFCRPKEVGMVVEMHARALSAIDSLCKLTPDNEEFLWVLWDLCRMSRSECGRQALLVLVNFPEALAVLMTALHSGKELDPASSSTGVSPVNLAIFHSAAEIFEVVVTDSTATSLASWIDHAKELHLALHSSSASSTKRDAPARLLQWIDASVVYHRNGATGLLRYAAVLASGGDAHMAANSVISSDMMDVDNVVGDSSSGPDGNVIDNLIGKRITEKDFPGVILRDSSVAQLTTAFRILACISDNSVVAAALYDDGAVMVIHALVINCKLMLERSSNIYDYLIDEGAEGNSTSDMLLERNREKNLINLLIPSLVLLVNLLQKLQYAKVQHRNTKLMNALLQLHREVSPKLAACGADLLLSCPDNELGYGAVCHLLASSLACWPIYNWTPGLFHFLLDSLHTTSLLALGPKETCSLFCLLNDLFPDGSIWLWKNGMPMLSALRSLAVSTLLGSQKEKQINWYLRAGHPEKLLVQLAPQLAKLGEIILHCAITMSAVIQDILRVFIIRVACLSIDSALVLLRPITSWISLRLLESSTLSETDAFKVHQLLNFLSMMLEHPLAKPLLLKEAGFQMVKNVLELCFGAVNSDVKLFSENITSLKDEFSPLSWCLPLFKSIALTVDARTSAQYSRAHARNIPETFAADEYCILWSYLLQFCMVLPVGRELLVCLSAVKEMGSSTEGRSALLSIFADIKSSMSDDPEAQNKHESDINCSLVEASEWMKQSPLLCCWSNLIRSINSKDVPVVLVADAISMLSSGALSFCINGNSINADSVALIKFLFGVKNDSSVGVVFEKDLKDIEELTSLLGAEMNNQEASESLPTFYQVKETANLLVLLLHSGTEVDEKISSDYISLVTPVSSKIRKITNRRMEQIEGHTLDEVGARFSWECPENLRERLSQIGLPAKRKISALDGPSRRARGETTAESSFSRGSVPVVTPSGPTRRDNFRQRKPNTSRPPSMHVDDYVARERNADGTYSNSNVIAIPRIGSSSGRPPSIHVDEFMARQRDRHGVVGASSVNEVKTTAPDNNTDAEKSSNKSQPMKPDLDDDLQGIDIVFDAEEAEPDDKLPFPQPDDILQQSASATVDQRSRSVVEETESDSRLGTPLASIMDENTPELSSRMSASRHDRSLTREPSISSDKKLSDQPEDSKSFLNRTSSAINSPILGSSGAAAASVYMNNPSGHFLNDSRRPPNLYPKANQQQSGSQGFHDQKYPSNQPPLPPMPPPQQFMDQSQFHQNYNVRPEYMSAVASSPSLASPNNLSDPKFGRTSLSSPGGSRPPPPLPPTPPPYSTNSSPLSSVKNSTSQSAQYFQTEHHQTSVAPSFENNLTASGTMLTSYSPAPYMQPLLYRPGSMPPVNFYGNSLVPHHGDNLPSVSQNISIMPSVNQFQPLQPQQIHRPPQHLRPPVPASPVSEQGLSLSHSSLHMQAQQPLVAPPAHHVYYQSPQQDNASQLNPNSSGVGTSQEQDAAATLQEIMKSPASIQELLNDRVKLCKVLEQYPKLMQMLQAHLGQN